MDIKKVCINNKAVKCTHIKKRYTHIKVSIKPCTIKHTLYMTTYLYTHKGVYIKRLCKVYTHLCGYCYKHKTVIHTITCLRLDR